MVTAVSVTSDARRAVRPMHVPEPQGNGVSQEVIRGLDSTHQPGMCSRLMARSPDPIPFEENCHVQRRYEVFLTSTPPASVI